MSELMLVNPRRKRKTAKRKSAKRNPSRRRKIRAVNRVARVARRRIRRNPKGIAGIVKTSALIEAAIGAAGSVGYDALTARLPIPAQLKSGMLGTAVKIGGAFVATKFAAKFVGAKTANAVLAGILTVEAVKLAQRFLMPTGTVAEYLPEMAGPGEVYMSGPGEQYGMGYTGPAVTLNEGEEVGAYVGAYIQ